jgi:uncharacterized protein YktB (UPF0637 family)
MFKKEEETEHQLLISPKSMDGNMEDKQAISADFDKTDTHSLSETRDNIQATVMGNTNIFSSPSDSPPPSNN